MPSAAPVLVVDDRSTSDLPRGFWPTLVALYFATRTWALTALPIFLDETAHIRWARAIAEGDKWDKPWQSGKGLSIFLGAFAFPWADDALWAGRFVNVLLGALTLVATVQVARLAFGRDAGLWAGALGLVCPYALFYDRTALTDPAMATFGALTAWACLRLLEGPSTLRGLSTGGCLAMGVLSKALGVLLAPIPALAVLLPGRGARRLWGPLALAYAAAVAVAAYPLWRFSRTTSTVRVAVAERGTAWTERVAANVSLAGEWLWTYLTPPVALLVVAGIVLALADRARLRLWLAAQVLLPLAALIAVSHIWFPRYLVFLVPPALVLAASALAWGGVALAPRLPARGRLAAVGFVAVVVLIPGLRTDVALWTDPASAPLPEIDRFQFVNGWPSGYGVRETVEYVRRERERQPGGVTTVTHGPARRSTPMALGLAFWNDPLVDRQNLNLRDDAAVGYLEQWSERRPVIVIVSEMPGQRKRPSGERWGHLGELVLTTRRPDGTVCDEVYLLPRRLPDVDDDA